MKKTNTIETKILEEFEEKLGWEFEGSTHSTEEDEAFKNRVKAFLTQVLKRVQEETMEEYVLTETDILVATTEAMREANPWKQVTRLRDILIAKLKEKI